MATKLTLVAIVVAAAMVVAATPASGTGHQVEPQWLQALEVRSQELNRQYGLGEYSPAIRALKLRSEALNRQHGLGDNSSTVTDAINARERSMSVGREVAAPLQGGGEPAFDARGPGSADHFYANDNRFRVTPVDEPIDVAVTGSSDEIEWPQVGIGFGIGIALMLGLYLVMRTAREQQPAL
jgi:hypothetical protein